MVNVNIQIPDELHKKIKVKCAMEGITLKEYVINSIRRKLEQK